MQYTIGEVAKKLGITASTIRFYEQKGLFPYLLRDRGIRTFDDLDINWCQLLGYLKDSGMSVETMKRYVDLYIQGDATIAERQALVHEQKEILAEQIARLNKAMEMINFKCWLYDTAIEGGSTKYAREQPREKIPPDILRTIDEMGGFQPFFLKERYSQAVKD